MIAPARLTGPAEHNLELEVVGYEFPDIADAVGSDFDANWLMIRMNAAHGERQWSVTNAMLDTFELHNLIQWLRVIADGISDAGDEFLLFEQGLFLKRSGFGDSVCIDVHIGHELLPPDLKKLGKAYVISFSPEVPAIRNFADGLEEMLRMFPVRAVEKDGGAQRWIQEHP